MARSREERYPEKQQQEERYTELTANTYQFASLHLLGERVCLDFINTVDPRADLNGRPQKDYLTNSTDLVRWSQYAHILSQDRADALLRAAIRHQSAAQVQFQRAIALRETLYRIFSAVATGQDPAATDLAVMQATYVEVIAQAHLISTAGSLMWQWSTGGEEDALDQVLWPVIRSAMDLLTSPEARQVKICPGLGDCGWLFLDTSRSGQRRWCSMESCGSRAKMRRYYARKHATSILAGGSAGAKVQPD
jgi:predicted RNA-binding Zn ribbon-like protein